VNEWYRLDVSADSGEYVALCLDERFPERKEPRNIRALGAFETLLAANRESGPAGTRRAAEELLAQPDYADHDVLYTWLLDEDDPASTLRWLRQGLDRCPRRRFLLDRLGWTMLDLGFAPEALYYWAQAAGNAARAGDTDEFPSYLYLARVARVCRMWVAAGRFDRRANPPGATPTELEPRREKLIDEVFGEQRTKPMKKVLRALSRG
jgi:hypothetical protein